MNPGRVRLLKVNATRIGKHEMKLNELHVEHEPPFVYELLLQLLSKGEKVAINAWGQPDSLLGSPIRSARVSSNTIDIMVDDIGGKRSGGLLKLSFTFKTFENAKIEKFKDDFVLIIGA